MTVATTVAGTGDAVRRVRWRWVAGPGVGVRAGCIVFTGLLLLYGFSLAPRVTFWDAGEFIAAVESWGIPHPPGTPLYVTLARAVHVLTRGVPTALAVNALSAVCTAAACALGAGVLARAGLPIVASVGAGLCAGSMSSVWLSATEAEVYSASLLLSALMIVAAQRSAIADATAAAGSATRWRALLVYLFALAAPVHASALVAGPAAIWLAFDSDARAARSRLDAFRLGGTLALAFVAAALLATGRFVPALVAAGLLALLAIDRRSGARRALIGFLVGATPLLIMLLRARHDPSVNQGDPSSWRALGDVIARHQYEVAGLFPRRAPLWVQVANFFQYADWQVALGLAPESTASVLRIVASLAFLALGVIGARAHRRRHRQTFRAMLVLLLSASAGVIVYLNLRAGPSIGWGILPPETPHEARERDYFFALAFWTWGLWAGYGAVELASRRLIHSGARAAAAAGLMLAALPAILNWPAMNRRREPDASGAALFADLLLASTPPNGALVVWGDNDSYPLWEAQRARGLRRDVVVITSPLLGVEWYRDELRRRWRIDAGPRANEVAMVERAVASARYNGRPIAIAITVPAEVRRVSGQQWSPCGIAWVDAGAPCSAPAPDSLDRIVAATPFGRFTDHTTRSMLALLRCPSLFTPSRVDSAAADSLARACNTR